MQCLSEIYKALGDMSASDNAASIHQQAVIDFNTLFWNDTLKQYSDWIDIDGNT